MSEAPRRSGRRAYVSLAVLQERAKAVATAEEQAAFWGEGPSAQDIDDDESFDENGLSDEAEDVVDSDFDEPESVDNDDDRNSPKNADAPTAPSAAEAAVRTEERRAMRRDRTSRYVDPATKKRNTVETSNQLKKDGTTTGKEKRTVTNNLKRNGQDANATASGTRSSLRKSTKAASARAAEQRERRRVGEAARRKQKAIRDAGRTPVRPLTQAERLEAAKITEELNRDSLADLLRMEEEKKRVPVIKRDKQGDVISARSKNGKWTVSFPEGVDVSNVMFPHLSERTGPA